MHLVTVLFILRWIAVNGAVIRPFDPAIRTSSGTYSGISDNVAGVETFKGIRYAEPPVGDLRFAAPVTVAHRSGILDASNFGNACPQLPLSDAFTILYGSPSLAADVGEDCLFLNIYRPAGIAASEHLPILVFIHGGAYSLGAGSQFDGTAFVQRSVANGSPIIFITINYRLYITGFLGSASVAPEDLNAGLLDQRMALRFIHDNACNFGGDATKVTLWGQSAGASSISMHYLYGASEPLFRAGIQNSGAGTILNVPSVEQYDLPGKPFDSLMNVTGCTNKASVLECLRAIPLQDLLQFASVVDALSPQAAPGQSTTWLPTLGPSGSLINADLPSAITAAGNYLRIPLITGSNLDEGTLFGIEFLNLNQTPSMNAVEFDSFVANRSIDPSTVSSATLTKINLLYPQDPSAPPADNSLFSRLTRFVVDFHFVAPRRMVTDYMPETQDVWAYQFEEPIPGLPDYLGVFHGSELTYLNILNRTVPAAAEFSSQYMDFYLNFTVNINPGLAWPKYTSDNRQILQLRNGNVTMVSDSFRLDETQFMNSAEVNKEFGH